MKPAANWETMGKAGADKIFRDLTDLAEPLNFLKHESGLNPRETILRPPLTVELSSLEQGDKSAAA